MKRKFAKAWNLFGFWWYSHFMPMFLRLKKNRVVFLSESHTSLDGNLKAMYDFLDGKGYDLRVHIKGDRRRTAEKNEKKAIMKDLTTSKYIFLDDYYGYMSAMRVRKGQKIVQLWHGAGAFKKFGYSRLSTEDSLAVVHSGYRKYTNVTVSSEFVRPCYSEAFDIPLDRVKATGIPRTDIFFDPVEVLKSTGRVYQTYPELKKKKVVLVAPTYRGDKVEDADYDFERLNLEKLRDALGDKYIIMVRWHPALAENIRQGKVKFNLPEGIVDASDYDDVNGLILTANFLITDYSSIIFEYFLLNRPIIYFAYDLEKYAAERGLYYDFSDYVYGVVAMNCDDIIRAVGEEKMFEDRRRIFGKKFMNACRGHSAENVYDWVFREDIYGTGK